MTEIKTLLEIRRAAKKKKPHFVSKDTHKKVRVPFKWKKPRGRHSPVRQKHRGRPKLVSIGYGSPKAVKHLHSSGLQSVIVQNKKQLENIDPKTQGIVLSRTIGNKKRIELIKFAIEKKFPILNLKNTQEYLEELESQFEKRKESKKKKFTEREKKVQEKKKKAEEKEKEENDEKNKEKTVEEAKEEKKEEEKKIEKTLIKKQ